MGGLCPGILFKYVRPQENPQYTETYCNQPLETNEGLKRKEHPTSEGNPVQKSARNEVVAPKGLSECVLICEWPQG